MSLTFELDPEVTPARRDQLLRLWAEVSNAGGSVGFVPPVTEEDVRPELLRHLAQMAEGRTRLLAGLDEQGRVSAAAFLVPNRHRLMRHWIWLYTVMVHPARQGEGAGRALMDAVAQAAAGLAGVRGIRLTLRGGTGLERFYGACGYKEVGRVPDAIRVADDDLRDDVTMWLTLS
ncbi:hypothetical protein N566_20825 [Streptomycetaceae bacterium MP113-05]|nr:hypothetical protein N566_20825 [Streptomycetaceae bacterium MP113-05]